MQVILLEPVKKLGNVGETVKVRDGFARNFLIPSKKAIRATEDNIKYFEAKKAEIEKENAKKIAEAEAVAKKVNGTVFTIVRQAGEDGRLYGSVSAKDISDALNKAGHDIARSQVVLNTPVKYIGVYTIELHLHGDVSATVHPNVSRSEDEAKDAKKRFERGEVVMEGRSEEEKKADAAAQQEAEAKAGKAEAAEEEKAADADAAEEKKAKKPAAKKAKAPKKDADAAKAEAKE